MTTQIYRFSNVRTNIRGLLRNPRLRSPVSDTLYSNMKSFLQHPFPERMKVLTLGRSGGAFRAVVQAQTVAVAALPPVLGTRAGPGVSVAQVPPET